MKRIDFAVLTLCLMAGTLRAQETERPVLLTSGEALQLTATRNPQTAASAYQEEAAEKEKKAAFGLRLPNVGVAGTYAHLSDDMEIDMNGLKQPVGQLAGQLGGLLPPAVAGQIGGIVNQLTARNWAMVLQKKDMALAGATVTMPVFTGGKINAANNAAKIRLAEARTQGDQTRNSLVSELAERYFGLSLANQVVEVRRQVLEGMEKHLHDAQALEANGMIARTERLYAEMHVAEARKDLLKAIRDARTMESALGNTLNDQGAYTPVTTLFFVQGIEDVNYFKTLALEKSPLLKQVELKKELAQEGAKAIRADFMPQVALMGGYDFYNYQLTDLAPTWAVGAGVKLTIFNGLNREYKYSAAKSQVRQVNALQEKANADLSTMVEKVYNEMMTGEDQLASIETALKFAEEYLRAKEKAFLEGMAPSSDVVDARLNLAKIKTERLQAAYTYDVLLARLLELCGDSETYLAYITDRPITPIRFE